MCKAPNGADSHLAPVGSGAPTLFAEHLLCSRHFSFLSERKPPINFQYYNHAIYLFIYFMSALYIKK